MIGKIRKLLALALAVLGLTLTACTGQSHYYSGNDITGLSAYGVQNGSVFDCYYIDDVYEVGLLEEANLCPPGSVAMAAPLDWRERNWAYYSSQAYYNRYMPAQYRSHYTSVYIVNFSSQYSKQIAAAEKNATYKTSSGKTVSGNQIKTGTLKFSSGNPVVHATAPAVIGGGSTRAPAKSVRGGVTAPPKTTTRVPAKSVRHT